MKNTNIIQTLLKEFRTDPDYIAEQLVLRIGEMMVECMELRRLSRSELAERMNVSKAYVTKLLDGKPNMTVRTLANVAVALDASVDVKLRCRFPRPSEKEWLNKEDCEGFRAPEQITWDKPYEEAQAIAAAA